MAWSIRPYIERVVRSAGSAYGTNIRAGKRRVTKAPKAKEPKASKETKGKAPAKKDDPRPESEG